MAMDSVDAPQIIEHISKSVNFTPYETRWVPCSARLVTMGIHPKATGALEIYQLQHGELKMVHQSTKPQGIKCGTFNQSALEDRQLATGDYAGMLSIYDLERTEVPLYSVKAHDTIVNTIDGAGGGAAGYGAPELATASRDGCVRVWDPRQAEPVVSLEPDEGEAKRDCWTVCFGNSFNDDERVLAAGYDNGDVKVFDMRANAMLWETNVSNGVVSLEFDRRDIEMNKLLCCTLESKFRLYDVRTRHPTEGYSHLTEKAHKSTVWMGRHLPQNRDLFMTCGGNGGLNIYKYSYPANRVEKDSEGNMRGVLGGLELLNSRVISTQPIVSFDWSPDKEGLCCFAALDQQIRVYIVTKLHKY